MVDDEDLELVEATCREEECDVEEEHPPHLLGAQVYARSGARLKRRRGPTKPLKVGVDSEGLDECVHKQFEATDWPLLFRDVRAAVLDDFGTTTDRSIARRLAREVESGFLKRVDLGTAFGIGFTGFAYIRADSKRSADPDNLREYLSGRCSGWFCGGASNAVRVR